MGAGSTTRSTGRFSGSLRGPRCGRRRCVLAVSGAAISALVSASACVSSRSALRQFERLDAELAALRRLAKMLAARLGQLQLQPLDLERANFGFVLRLAQRRFSLGQLLALGEDHGVRAREVVRKVVRQAVGRMFEWARHDADVSRFGSKCRPRNRALESIGRSHPAAVGRQVFCGVRQSTPDNR